MKRKRISPTASPRFSYKSPHSLNNIVGYRGGIRK